MMTLDEIRKALKDRNLKAVAIATQLNPQTLYRLARGEVTPHHSTVQVLINYLKETTYEKN